MEYLFLKRKKSTLRSERQRDLLFKAAERHWDEQFAGQGIVGRKVDCYIYNVSLSIGNSSGVFGWPLFL